MERSPGPPSDLLGNEGFLVDGIIEMGLDRSRGKLARYLRVEKMRACEHSHGEAYRRGGGERPYHPRTDPGLGRDNDAIIK